jgi:hypothetical protein
MSPIHRLSGGGAGLLAYAAGIPLSAWLGVCDRWVMS